MIDHTIGDVDSYPRSPDRGGLWSSTVFVGQGSGENSVRIETTTGSGHGGSFDFTVETEAKVQAGPVVVGAYASYRLGYEKYQRLFNVGFRIIIPVDAT